MKAFGQIEFSTLELQEELQFEIVRGKGWTEYLLAPFIGLFALWMIFEGNTMIGMIALLAGGASLAANTAHGPITRLRVRKDVIIATGNLQRTFIDEIRIPTHEIKSIGWQTGGENDPSGLYVSRKWGSTCVLPGITEEQACTIVDAIARSFPDIVLDNSPGSFLFGESSGLTTLDLNSPRPEDRPNNQSPAN